MNNSIIMKAEECLIKIKNKKMKLIKGAIPLRDNFYTLKIIREDTVRNTITTRAMATTKKNLIDTTIHPIKILGNRIIKSIIEIIKITIETIT